jgi:uncharacterized protein YrrD
LRFVQGKQTDTNGTRRPDVDNDFTPHLTGQEVIGQRGEAIGKAADVLYEDEAADHPTWVRVDHGLLHSKHTLVPLQGAYQEDDGRLVVAFDKDTVHHAPKVKTDVAMTKDLKDRLVSYYGVSAN